MLPQALAPTPVAEIAPVPFDIHSYPSTDLLRLLASLLTQIAATNDKLDTGSGISDPSPSSPTHSHGHSSSSSSIGSPASLSHLSNPIFRSLTTASQEALATPTSTLTFHARNVPTISLEAYLLRILKYCPTTNEVFLSLLVYFDRMSKLNGEATGRTFVIDSYNIHRLVIAGVTVASKFFSDVFYTNSRYAKVCASFVFSLTNMLTRCPLPKVGGLPQSELNQLELQFLLLNDFTLVIPKDEMQRYAEQLILFSKSPDPVPTSPTSATGMGTTTPTMQSLIPAFVASASATGASPVVMSGARSTGAVAGPSQTMGAYDAYGGQVLSPSLAQSTSVFPFPQPSKGKAVARPPPPMLQRGGTSHGDTDTETETETEPETDTDNGSTTDDEPTIRPAHSIHSRSSGGSEADTRSICSSNGTAESYEDDGDSRLGDDENDKDGEDNESMEVEYGQEGEGERTPERLGRGLDHLERTPEGLGFAVGRRVPARGRDDHRMASP